MMDVLQDSTAQDSTGQDKVMTVSECPLKSCAPIVAHSLRLLSIETHGQEATGETVTGTENKVLEWLKVLIGQIIIISGRI